MSDAIRDTILKEVAYILGRPVQWADRSRYVNSFDGIDRAVEVYNVEADKHLALLENLRPHRENWEKALGGPMVFLFFTQEKP